MIESVKTYACVALAVALVLAGLATHRAYGKIDSLSVELGEQKQLVKERDGEIKSLASVNALLEASVSLQNESVSALKAASDKAMQASKSAMSAAEAYNQSRIDAVTALLAASSPSPQGCDEVSAVMSDYLTIRKAATK